MIEQEIVEPDHLNFERRKWFVGKIANVVRDDRVCAGDERAGHNLAVVLVGENDRVLEALPARHRRIFQRIVHTVEAILDLLCFEVGDGVPRSPVSPLREFAGSGPCRRIWAADPAIDSANR